MVDGMHTLLVTLHVVTAIFLVGPLAVAPHSGIRAIRNRDARACRSIARQTTIFGVGSVIVALLGAAVVPTKPEWYDFSTTWLTISMTLYIIAAILVFAVVAPSLRTAAKLVGADEHAPDAKLAAADDAESGEAAAGANPEIPPQPQASATTSRVDRIRGRVAAVSGLVTLLLLAIAVLMVVKPFG